MNFWLTGRRTQRRTHQPGVREDRNPQTEEEDHEEAIGDSGAHADPWRRVECHRIMSDYAITYIVLWRWAAEILSFNG